MTHAFFKALLFLAAGVVIHALGGEQDMRRMGGMRRYLPKTFLAMLIGALSLVGHPAVLGLLLEGPDPVVDDRGGRLVGLHALRHRRDRRRS